MSFDSVLPGPEGGLVLRGPDMPELLCPEILADLFEASALRTPHAIALSDGVTSLTYEELNTQADRAANHLLARGIGGGDMVGLWLPRGIPLLVLQLAIAKNRCRVASHGCRHPRRAGVDLPGRCGSQGIDQ